MMSKQNSSLSILLLSIAAFLVATALIAFLILKRYLFNLTILGRISETTIPGYIEYAALLLAWLGLGAFMLKLIFSRLRT